MRKIVLCLLVMFCLGIFHSMGQEKIEVSIIATSTDFDSIFIEDGEGIIIDTVLVSLSTDDAEQENDEIDALFDDDLDAGWEGQEGDENILTMGLRFQNIEIPGDATIDSAFILVYSHEEKMADDVAKITIYGEASDNAVTFDEDNLITSRPSTTSTIDWTVAEAWSIWKQYKTPDLKAIIQEIVSRNGWAAGNAMAIILTGENQGASDVENAREMESFENISDPGDEDAEGNNGDGKNHPERAPKLVVYFNGSQLTSIKNTNNELISIYPSVVSNGYITITAIENMNTANVSIINITGNLVFEQQAVEVNNGMTIDLSSFSQGIYFISVQNEQNLCTKQFVIQ